MVPGFLLCFQNFLEKWIWEILANVYRMSTGFKNFPLCLFCNHAFDGGGHALGNGDNCPFSTSNLFLHPLSAWAALRGLFYASRGLHLGSTEKRKNPLAALKFCLPSLRLSPLFCVCHVWVTTGGVEIGSQPLHPYSTTLVLMHKDGIMNKYTGTNVLNLYISTNVS